MSKLGFALVALAVLTVMVAPSVYAANEYCVFRNSVGQLAVSDGKAAMDSGAPIYGWYKEPTLCASTSDGAVRMSGTGTLPLFVGYYRPNPNLFPEHESGPFMAEPLP